ncbi:MAG: hypothetical protein M1818_003502 [Claussenomyces sp. TS43310]|nr:MAG: hypothetical protein M1818_003502 [Claussenomyces sp. TS43310]
MVLLRLFLTLGTLWTVSGLASSNSDKQQYLLSDSSSRVERTSDWRFNFSSAAPHYFASIHGLLQQWPNTFFPNGHSIAPGTIAPFTKLYHGRRDADTPPSPEWLSFDIEMAYGIMGSTQQSFMLTYQTTRPVPVLYFDGESAALMGTGQMDTQMLHIYGNVSGPERHDGFRGLADEYARAAGLCHWLNDEGLGGLGWGFEGIVRMNAGFELIWCNFTSPSLRLVSHLNVSAPLLPPESEEMDLSHAKMDDASPTKSYFPLPPQPTNTDKANDPQIPPLPPNWRKNEARREPFLASQAWGWFVSATNHYGSSGLGSSVGETRVKLISCGLLNYYSPEFESQALGRAFEEQEQLNLTTDGLWLGPRNQKNRGTDRQRGLEQLMRRRRTHTLNKISPADALTMRAASERVLGNIVNSSQTHCSGIDWIAVTNEIVQRYAGDLIAIRLHLRTGESLSASNYTSVRDWLMTSRQRLHALLVPFLEYPSDTRIENAWKEDSESFRSTFARCKYHHTRLLVPEEGIRLGPEEESIKWAVEETMDGICSVIVSIGFAVEKFWAKDFNERPTLEPASGKWKAGGEVKKDGKRWISGVEELMAWLGWAGEWTRCKEMCAWDEECYIPMWPLMNMRWRPGGPGGRPGRPPHGPPRTRPGEEDPPGGGPPDNEDLRVGSLEDEKPSPGGEKRPDHREPGSPDRPGGPDEGMDETDLWQPKCVKSAYIMKEG